MMSKRSKPTAAQQAARALKIARTLQNSREKKFIVLDFPGSHVTRLGRVDLINFIEQGNSDSTRVGDRILCFKITVLLNRVMDAGSTGYHSLRFVIIHDKQNTISNANRVFLNPDNEYAPNCPFVKDRQLEYSVLYDSHANHMDEYNTGDCTHITRNITIKTQFVGAGTTISSGALKIVALSNQPSTASPPQLYGTIRLDYTDA
jgi:hypothetical protein